MSEYIRRTGYKLLISSTWREGRSPEYFERLFSLACEESFPSGSIIGCTPVMDHIEERKRGNEINQWIIDNKWTGKFVIIDDDGTSIFLPDHPLIQIDREVGITKENLIYINKK